jgi:hypothetical protein
MYFEDMPGDLTNFNQLVPGNTIRHILEHPTLDPSWQAHATSVIAWIESSFGKPLFHGARPIAEQTQYWNEMGSHTSRYGAVNALYFMRTGSAAAREKAYRALNWATYANLANGDTVDWRPTPNQIWVTDSYGDFVKHFIVAMYAVPEWAPPGEDHLLWSSSVVQAVAYAVDGVSYRTFDGAAREKLRLTFTPATITANGAVLSQRPDLEAEGWTWDPALRVLEIRHDHGREIVVRSR